MNELRRHAEDYLRLRRSLGFKLTLHGPLLAGSSTTSIQPARRPSRPSLPSPSPSSHRAFSRSSGHTGSAWSTVSPATCRQLTRRRRCRPMTSSLRATSARRPICGRKPKCWT